MKTASIGHRVADFLRRYPPFEYANEAELLDLARDGRVQFHEYDEILFQQGQPRKRFVYVIQQGVVRLLQETDHGELLRDIRGDGDLLGIGRFRGDPEHGLTARTDTDVILYALPADAFAALVDRHPRAARFLSAYFSLPSTPPTADGLTERRATPRLGTRPIEWMERVISDRHALPTCTPHTTVRDLAKTLAQGPDWAALVTDPEGAPIGVATLRSLGDRVATGELPFDTPVGRMMDGPPPAAPPGLEAGKYLIRMLESESRLLALTPDGRAGAPLAGILTRDDLDLQEGASLLAIADQIARASDTEDLARLYLRAEDFLAGALSGPESLRWLGPITGGMKIAVLRRTVTLAEEALAAEGHPSPDSARCWVFFGASGRNELLTRNGLEYGLIYEVPQPDAEGAARDYFLELDRRVDRRMSACGFRPLDGSVTVDRSSACRSVSEWKSAFTKWIRDPIEGRAYRATCFFDLRAVCGDGSLVQALRRHIDAQMQENPSFVRLLANDSMENLPPLTFFRGLVIDEEGTEIETLDLKHATLAPVADVARTMALDCASTRTSTLDRLKEAQSRFGDDEQLLAETSSAFVNALYLQARAGFTEGSDADHIAPGKLTRYEQRLLKSGFRAVLRLLEHAGRRYGLTPE